MKVSICIGSACHLKGSREVIRILQKLVQDNNLENQVDLTGAFCSGNCRRGVCVTIDDEEKIYSVQPDNAKAFFEDEILTRVPHADH